LTNQTDIFIPLILHSIFRFQVVNFQFTIFKFQFLLQELLMDWSSH